MVINDINCIFCNNITDEDTPIEHIWPESLGANSFIAPFGTVCKSCNNYFSREIERFALESFPFKFIRSFFGIPTKKKKVSISKTELGDMYGKPGGRYFYLKSSELNKNLRSGEIDTIQLILSTRCEHPSAVCRLLLKMAIECIAKENLSEAYSDKFNSAKQFARFPKRGSQWNFAIEYKNEYIFDSLKNGLSSSEDLNASMRFTYTEDGPFYILEILGITLITPLLPNEAVSDFTNPDFHIYNVKI